MDCFAQLRLALWSVVISALFSSFTATAASPSYILFESGQVRPLAMSPDGSRLFAVNTADNRVAIFRITGTGVDLEAEVPVGLEPVAVAARNNHEIWVVNHLSDSVSIVSLKGTPRVVRTLLVGDEPSDIVFAGAEGQHAFITTAHRGQQRTDPSIADVPGAGDPQLTIPGVGRADVWVFNVHDLGTTVGGTPLKIVTLFGDTTRALAVSPDKRTVYAAVFKSGNQTTAMHFDLICRGFMPFVPCVRGDVLRPGGLPLPATNRFGDHAPEVGLIVKFNKASGHWEDQLGRNWDQSVGLKLPDLDVFAIDADTLTQTAAYPHVGTTLFNMAVNPVSGKLYVSNTEAINQVRFAGPGTFGGSTVQGHLAESRITVISESGVEPRHLNKHIDYSILADNPAFDRDAKNHSLATPTDMAVSRDGSTLYVAALGSSKIGVFSTKALERDTFDPKTASRHYIAVAGGGPSGVILDEKHDRLYVLTRFDNSLAVIDLKRRTEVARTALYNPEPASVVNGRPFLYDAFKSSANGEAACASCHIFGNGDNLAWDLGDPDAPVTKNPLPINIAAIANLLRPFINGTGKVDDFHPMKGPLVTQTLRGLKNSGAMHWRGDRANGFFGTDPFDTNLSFLNFIVAFTGLLGNATMPSRSEMQAFADFQLQVTLPPNPVRPLNNVLTASAQRGSDFFHGTRRADGLPTGDGLGFTCNDCHTVDPAQGLFGTSRRASVEPHEQTMKMPHLRDAYDRVGMFGTPLLRDGSFNVGFTDPAIPIADQVRGFGYFHDGTLDTIFRFLSSTIFLPGPGVGFTDLPNPQQTRRDLEQYIFAFDTDLAPIVGQQVTLTRDNADAVNPRIDLLIGRAQTPFVSKVLGGNVTECDLVAKVAVHRFRDRPQNDNRVMGWLYEPATGTFRPDDGTASLTDRELRHLANIRGQEVTYTCVPPGSGVRIGINRRSGQKLDGK